jgi:signal peptidase I
MNENVKTSDEEKPDLKGGILETLSTILWAVGIAFVLRTFVFQPFHIPSGSMVPGLVKGDYIITSKFTVGFGKHAATPFPFPVKKGRLFERKLKRGDVIVFRPEGDTKNFIKRVVGLPGDQIQMKQGLLYINGERLPVETVGMHEYANQFGNIETGDLLIETFANGNAHQILDAQKNSRLDRTELRTVPSGYYFMMGDNRDHSYDSRVSVAEGGAGIVPKENIIGKAEIVLLSVNEDFVLVKPWTWLNMRGDRWFKGIE